MVIIKTMKYKMKLLSVFVSFSSLLALFVSCANEDATSNGKENEHPSLTCEARSKTFANEAVTRSALDYNASSGMSFRWTQGDWLSIFAQDNDYSVQNFSIKGEGGGTKAEFVSTDFDLTAGKRYFAISKSEQQTEHENFIISSQNNITLDYSGQVQKGNGSTAHLGKYDYMVASTICESKNAGHFSFTHLGATLRLMLYVPTSKVTEFTGCTFTELEIYDSENKFVQPARNFAFSAGTTAEGYQPSWPDQVFTSKDRFKLTLKNAAGTAGLQPSTSENFLDGSGPNTYGDVVTYIEVPPYDFTGKTIGVMLKGKDSSDKDVVYSGTAAGFNVSADHAYRINFKMTQSPEFLVQLKVNRDWQLGATTRATTGDPGNEDKFEKPTYIHYIYCHDGKVVSPNETGTAVYVNTISNIAPEMWTVSTDGIICAYNDLIRLYKHPCSKTSEPGHVCTYHLYAIASTSDLTEHLNLGGDPLQQINENTTENQIKALTYNIISGTQEQSQTFLKNLSTTAWDVADTKFLGALTDPMQDIILYHTAAKVDLQWNSTVAITGDVKVNNVMSTKLSLFKPTDNSSAETATYTVTSTLENDRYYNGRQVFYLPQFTSYNAWIGSEVVESTPQAIHEEDVRFTPAITNGFTSWLRWMRTY